MRVSAHSHSVSSPHITVGSGTASQSTRLIAKMSHSPMYEIEIDSGHPHVMPTSAQISAHDRGASAASITWQQPLPMQLTSPQSAPQSPQFSSSLSTSMHTPSQ